MMNFHQRKSNYQPSDLLLQVYVDEFRPRHIQYQNKDEILTLEVEYLFGVVLRSMSKRHRLSQKTRKDQLEQTQDQSSNTYRKLNMP